MRSSITFVLAFVGRLEWGVARIRIAGAPGRPVTPGDRHYPAAHGYSQEGARNGLRRATRRQVTEKAARRRALSAVAVGALSIAAGAFPASASANQAHYYAGLSFGETGNGSGQLELQPPEEVPGQRPVGGSALAVNETSHNVYVADTGNHRVEEFEADGTFRAAFGADVGGPGIDSCTSNCVPGTSGNEPGEFEAPTFIAIDQTDGDLYVGDPAAGIVTKLTEAGELVSAWGQGGSLGVQPIVVARGTGDLTAGSTKLANQQAGFGQFGQLPISGEGIATGTRLERREGELQLSRPATQTKVGVSLTQATAFGPLAGVAVRSGELFVFANGLIFRFAGDGTYAGMFGEGSNGAKPAGFSFDGEGSSYRVDGLGKVEKLDPSGGPLGLVVTDRGAAGSETVGLAASLSDAAFYADVEGGAISAYSSHCQHHLVVTDPVCDPFQTFGEGRLDEGAGLAVDSRTSTVYAASAGNDEILAFPPAVEAVTEAATGRTASAATLNGKIDAFGSALTGCHFEYGIGTAEGEASVPCEGVPGPHGEVHSQVTGLEGEKAYSYRLRATNAHGDVIGDERTVETLGSPGIESAEAKEVSAGSAILTAKIDPRGSETHYHFEWGPCEGSCLTSSYAATVPVPDGTILPGTPATVEAPIAGLQAGTTYHFRVFASSRCNHTEPAEHCPVTSAEHTFVYLPSAPIESGCTDEELRQSNGSTALPDCRAYELVTPGRKNGSLIGGTFLGVREPQIAEDGSSITAPAIQCLPGTPSCIAARQSEGEPYEFTRGPGGWQVNPLAPPAARFRTSTWLTFGAEPGTLLFSSPDIAGTEDLWARGEDGSLRAVGPIGEPGTPNSKLSPRGAVSTSDLSHLAYETAVPLWPFDEGRREKHFTPSLYEYTPTSGPEPQLVGVTGGYDEGHNHNLVSICGTGLGNGSATALGGAYNALSEDGRIVYFTAAACETGSGANTGKKVPSNALYERIDQSRTVEVSGTVAATCTSAECEGSPPAEATFEGASRSGERALFTSTQQLTDGASSDGHAADRTAVCATTVAGASGCNLYLSECPQHCEDPSQRRLVDVSEGAKAEGGPKVGGVVAMSADASHVYFVAEGALTATPDRQGEAAVAGAPNLFLYERDAAHPQGRLTFVAKLSPQDQANWEGGINEGTRAHGQGLGVANITPDGRYLVFESHRALTPGAAAGPAQIYRYAADSAQMTRISIGQAGFGDDGNGGQAGADAGIVHAKSAFVLGDGPARANPTMSGDGRFVFFQSPLALTLGALNEVVVEETVNGIKIYAQNVYEWEEDGSGACHEAGGCVSLLTDGTERVGGTTVATPELLGTDETGKNVFIAAEDRLTWQDTDTQRDYYDLKVGGGFAPPGAGAQPCSGDGCRGQGTSAGQGASPATATTNGPEEGPKHLRKAKQAKCKKGTVKKHGKCVKKATAKKNSRKKGSKAKHRGKGSRHH